MNTSAIRHLSFYPFVQAFARSKARFFLEAAVDDMTSCELVWWKRSAPEKRQIVSMHIIRSNRHMDQWTAEVSFQEETHYIKYGFRLTDQDGKTVWYNAYGFHTKETPEGSFEILQINETDVLRVPDWSQGCIYYQIFLDRFAKSGKIQGHFDKVFTADAFLRSVTDLVGATGHFAYHMLYFCYNQIFSSASIFLQSYRVS